MAAHTLPGIGLTGGRSPGEDGWGDEMNLNLLLMSTLAQLTVKSRVTALPGSPANGDIYIIPSPDNRVAVRDAGAWTYVTPFKGIRAYLADEDALVVFNGTAWVSAVTIPNPIEHITIALGDETTAITTGVGKVTFRMPYAFTVTGVRASLTTASTSGLPTFDINENGGSILSTKLTIDVNEKSSTTASTAAVITDTALADDAEITIDVDATGTGAAGAKIYIIGRRA